jgi:hypothetical protein
MDYEGILTIPRLAGYFYPDADDKIIEALIIGKIALNKKASENGRSFSEAF